MFQIICGEDNVASRNYLNQLKSDYIKKDYQVQIISALSVKDIQKDYYQSSGLFFNKQIFITENLNKVIARGDKLLDELKKIASDKELVLIDWEDSKPSRDLKIKTIGTLKEFKPNQSIFKLLDTITPGNKTGFITQLDELIASQDEIFIFVMISRHIRTLILAKLDLLPSSVVSWQKYKLIGQTKNWKIENLIKFYEGLFKIEIALKTSTSPYGVKNSLDILACYFL